MNDIAELFPEFPPLLKGIAVLDGRDPFQAAIDHAKSGGDPAHVFWAQDPDVMRAAITLAPDMALEDAMGGLMAVQLGMNDSLGALAPPEVPVHFSWPNRLRVNGGFCGSFRAIASTDQPTADPEWMVIGVEVPLRPLGGPEPGLNPNATTLIEEGCGDLTTVDLIESWSRHTLAWLHRFMDEGLRPLHESWRGKCEDLGKPVSWPQPGVFVGLDDKGGMLLQTDGKTDLIPLTTILEKTT